MGLILTLIFVGVVIFFIILNRAKKDKNKKTKKQKKSFKKIGGFNICPYCKKTLDVIPKRKKKCPYCGYYIYVRTRIVDNRKVLVTKKQKDEVDEQWQEAEWMESPEYYEEKEKLTKKFGREPKFRDIKWGILYS